MHTYTHTFVYQGLGFGSGGGGGVGAAQPGKWKKNAEAPSTSGFVKQGEGPALAVSSVNAAASTQVMVQTILPPIDPCVLLICQPD